METNPPRGSPWTFWGVLATLAGGFLASYFWPLLLEWTKPPSNPPTVSQSLQVNIHASEPRPSNDAGEPIGFSDDFDSKPVPKKPTEAPQVKSPPPIKKAAEESEKNKPESVVGIPLVVASKPVIFDDCHPLFLKALQANKALLHSDSGYMAFALANGQRLLVAVGASVVENETARSQLDAETRCRLRAMSSVPADREMVLTREESLKNKEVSEAILSRVSGSVRAMPCMGRWRSRDGQKLHCAFGVIVDAQGSRVEEEIK